MRLSKRGLTTLALMLALIAGLFLASSQAEAKTLRVGLIANPQAVESMAMEKVFKPYVEEKTKGAIKIKVFPSSQLGGAPDQVEGVKMGTQDMFTATQTWWEAHVPQVGAATVPFLFDDRAHFDKWVDEVFVKKIQKEIIKKANQRFISMRVKWRMGPYRVIVSKVPIMSLEDIQGLDLRLWPARMIQKSWAGLGVKVHTIDWSETYLALQQGIVKAMTSPFNAVWSHKLSEVAKYVTELKQFPQLSLTSINEDTWNSLKPEYQKILVEAYDKAGEWFNKTTDEEVQIKLGKMLKVHDAKYIIINRQPFVDKMHKEVIPGLIAEGILKKEWVDEIKSLK